MDCLFCRIARREAPASIVYEDHDTVVIRDINPQAPVHLLAIPKKHYSDLHEVPPSETDFFVKLCEAVSAVLRQEDLIDYGYRLVINSGRRAGQSIFHVHVHILSGRTMHWPPG
jgi:histidine triad (HIT) family protein